MLQDSNDHKFEIEFITIYLCIPTDPAHADMAENSGDLQVSYIHLQAAIWKSM